MKPKKFTKRENTGLKKVVGKNGYVFKGGEYLVLKLANGNTFKGEMSKDLKTIGGMEISQYGGVESRTLDTESHTHLL